MDQPNILVVMADQLAPHFTGAYGHPLVRTPAMDALAERGARFDAAYCSSPLCAPSRFSMMSGRLASEIGAFDNGAEFTASIPTMAHYLGHRASQHSRRRSSHKRSRRWPSGHQGCIDSLTAADTTMVHQ